jgi:hypothetical protein
MKLNNDPWKHVILENFLSVNHFNKLKEIAEKTKDKFNQDKFRISKLYDLDGNVLKLKGHEAESEYDLDDFAQINDLYDCYYEETKFILEYLNPNKVKDISLIKFELQTIQPYYEFDWHNDLPIKLLSIVIYISPDNNYGTIIAKSPESKEIESPWILNSGIAFSAKKNTTWHKFKANDKKRTTFNINLYKDFLK